MMKKGKNAEQGENETYVQAFQQYWNESLR